MTTLRLTAVGNSTGFILPKDLLEQLNLARGDVLNVRRTSEGILLSPYDPGFERAMDVAEGVERDFRDALHRLAQ